MTPAPAPKTGNIMLTVVDGTRKPPGAGLSMLVRVLDGRKRAVANPWSDKPNVYLPGLQCYGNNDDLYTVIAHARGYQDGAVYPVRLRSGTLVSASIMLLPENGQFHFQPLRSWQEDKRLHQLVASGAANAAERYAATYEEKPQEMGALLTIGTAIRDIPLDSGKSLLDFFWEVRWNHLMPDRFWAWVEAGLAERIAKLAALQMFAEEPDAGRWHPAIPNLASAATRSWKQTRFDVSNVQLTFHEDDRTDLKRPNGRTVHCVLLESDIDYYKDLLAHGLCEVLPNLATGGKTDPRVAYQLRWMATRQEGLPDFAPPCTVE
jgi:hypothetical protein